MKRIRTERHRTGLRALVAVAAALVVAVAAPAAAAGRFGGGSYGWPVRPFDRQHPVRGFFGDPRIGETPYGVSRSFAEVSDRTPLRAPDAGPSAR